MRLLKVDKDARFSLIEDLVDNERLKYAILSHTWGKDKEEVTFNDILQGTGTEKNGYKKILFCAQQAIRDDIQYIWVDTCCINKLNNNNIELQYAINSMFRWYQKAEKCYVYLQDVPTAELDTNGQLQTACELSVRNSKWLTRGWTLQELIAPKVVEFFSEDWSSLGSKALLERQLSEATGIPVQVLRGDSLEGFSVIERLSWAKDRRTRYEEDKVYSLQGIFNICISVRYGEGYDRALRRLQDEIQRSHQGKNL
jgi:hypothetical protein